MCEVTGTIQAKRKKGEKKGNWVKAQWNLVLCTALGSALSTRQKENKSPKLIILQFFDI